MPARGYACHPFRVGGHGLAHPRGPMLPGFLIVGAQRSGTTSMYRTLSQHPAILKAVLHKGVHYFDTGYEHDLAWYRGHFPLRAQPHASAGRGCSADLRVKPLLHVPSAGGGADKA